MKGGGAAVSCDPLVLEEIVKESGVAHRSNSISFIFTCPRCTKRDKLYIRKRDGRFVCWHCQETENYKGRPEYALTDLTGIPIRVLQSRLYGQEAPQAVLHLEIHLKDYFGDEDEVPDDITENLLEVCMPSDFYEIDHVFAKRGREYLAARGVDIDTAKHYGLRYCPPKQRIVFPVQGQGKLFGWQLRTVLPTEYVNPETGQKTRIPKALTMTGLKKELTLMFLDNLTGSDHAILCEGPMDAIKAGRCGGAVATMGKGVSRPQLQLLRNSGITKIYLALDPDAVAETTRLAHELGNLDLYLLHPSKPFKDLGEMTPDHVFDLYQSASNMTSANVLLHLGANPIENVSALDAVPSS